MPVNEMFKEYPYTPVEPVRVMELCRTDAKELNWNHVYLFVYNVIQIIKECPACRAQNRGLGAGNRRVTLSLRHTPVRSF